MAYGHWVGLGLQHNIVDLHSLTVQSISGMQELR